MPDSVNQIPSRWIPYIMLPSKKTLTLPFISVLYWIGCGLLSERFWFAHVWLVGSGSVWSMSILIGRIYSWWKFSGGRKSRMRTPASVAYIVQALIQYPLRVILRNNGLIITRNPGNSHLIIRPSPMKNAVHSTLEDTIYFVLTVSLK